MGGGFTGTLQVEGGGNLDANGEMKLRVKRAKVWFLCVPYGVRFEHVRTEGSHQVFKKAGHPHHVTVPHPKKDLKIGTLKNIEKQSGVKLK